MIPCDAKDLRKEYDILLNELKEYNPELLDKSRIIAITKCDMLDKGLIAEMKKEAKKTLPKGIKTVFISSVSGLGIEELKDVLWEELNK
jgi:GTP-binding protein